MGSRNPRLVGLVIAIASGGWLSACNSYERYGDARMVYPHSILFMEAPFVEYPKIPIGAYGTTSFRVPGNPRIQGLGLEIPAAEDHSENHDQPWRSTIIRVVLIAGDNKVIYERTIDFAKDWNGGSCPGEHGDHRQIPLMLPHPSLPAASFYRFSVEVLQPSKRATDRLRLMAPF